MISSTDSKAIKIFQEKILSWYKEHQRDLPWRKTRDPYKILISEIMSQQTQINRVIPKYEAWIERFPTVHELASASVAEVLSYWSGLGYNRRALNLKKTAEIISKEYNGKFPDDEQLLLALPGIGAYTSRAILCFAFNKQVAVVDTNVKKVILTQFNYRHRESEGRGDPQEIAALSLAMTEREIKEFAEKLLPHGHAYEWNQALMDYAGAVLSKEKIAIPKQSKFIGSRRYYRGQILKLLLKKKKISIKEVCDLFGKEEEWVYKLLEELEKEGFILLQKDAITLAD